MKRQLPFGVVIRVGFFRLIFPIVLLFLLPSMIRRMVKRGNFHPHLGQRFGFFSPELKDRFRENETIWLQSISVGETNVALKIARELLSREPDLQVVISVTTSTGFALASRSGSPQIHVIYNPIDLVSIVRRTLSAIRPRALILIEGTWPVLVAETWRRGIPVSLVARLSPRSARGFLRFWWFAGAIFALLENVFVQEPEEVDLWQQLGASPDAIHCTGAIKYDEPPADHSPNADLAAFLKSIEVDSRRPILLAGSTFAGEEEILAETFLVLRKKFPELFLILVPRHAERTPDILASLRPFDLQIALRTGGPAVERPDCLLVNTTGELRDWYAFATVVFIGKSLTSIGGQNPVEAALLGKPVIYGPHMENFGPVVRRWLQTDAAIQVSSASELPAKIEQLLADATVREAQAARAIQSLSSHFGATARVTDYFSPIKSHL